MRKIKNIGLSSVLVLMLLFGFAMNIGMSSVDINANVGAKNEVVDPGEDGGSGETETPGGGDEDGGDWVVDPDNGGTTPAPGGNTNKPSTPSKPGTNNNNNNSGNSGSSSSGSTATNQGSYNGGYGGTPIVQTGQTEKLMIFVAGTILIIGVVGITTKRSVKIRKLKE